jgi:hypothetical protein
MVVLVAAAGVTGASAAAAGGDATSTNWSGYAISDAATIGGSVLAGSTTLLSFSSVTGTWTQPRATCTSGSPTYSAFWIGLGGLASDSQALEQIGTSADCSASGAPVYRAWYEMVPSRPVRLSIKVLPGDLITASVNMQSGGVLVQIKNRTRRTSFTRLVPVAAPDVSSAEWIAEAPSTCNETLTQCRTLPLANFGVVSFSRIAAIANSHPGTITDTAWAAEAISLVPDNGGFSTTGGAAPHTVTADGRSFDVVWNA